MSDEDRTVFVPSTGVPPAPSQPPAFAPSPAEPASSAGTIAPMAARADVGSIKPGDVLNHIFEVKRFLARGGMGEVFEGINVTSDERVAIKVMLPALAADPNVIAMFRKEARTLTRLSHPALVQYRVLAQEPQLGVLYIVTEFIEGANLNDVLGAVKADESDLKGLLQRLAAGLQAAHDLGAIHRDISPDNVLLEHGELSKARVIDFGIAKDLDPGSKTIIGEGFAGKLSYVAPEQLGDFNREVGPWTDVYSLALVILAVANGGGIDLGGSFVDAIDKRRKGIALDMVPEGLRPVLGAMLQPNPAERLRSMDAVLAALAGAPVAPAAAPAPAKPARAPKPEKVATPKPPRDPSAKSGLPMPMIAGGAAAALMLVGGGAWWMTRGSSDTPAETATNTTAPAVTTPAANPAQAAERARAGVAAALPGIACSWLDLTGASGTGNGLTLKLTGVAGQQAQAQAAIARAVESSGASLAAVDFSDVAPISASECGSVDAFRLIRADAATHLTVPQRTFEMSKLGPGSQYAGQIGARTVFDLNTTGLKDFALYGLEPKGDITPLVADRKAFEAMKPLGFYTDLGNSKARFSGDVNHEGWSGYLLLTGEGGFSDQLVSGKFAQRGADWPQRFAAAAAKGNWHSEMVWFKTVDEAPN